MTADDKARIAALLREREGYIREGKKDRVAAVDAALKERGHKADSDARKTPPQGRSATPRQTTKE